MSVVIETTLGDITVDLYLKQRPRSCLNFLKLCKMKYYNFNLFHMVNRGFIAQTGDPTGNGDGGESVWGVIEGPLKRYFEGENNPRIKHTLSGLISFVGDKNKMIGSQFFITLGPDLTYLDSQHCVFGEVTEGIDVLHLLNESICDNNHRPYQDIRITHTVVLDDPFADPEELIIPANSPEPTALRLQGGRIAPDEDIDESVGKSANEIAEIIADREAKARATILEMVGDIPDAEMAPPENVLFVCKLNPVTNDDDLEIIFSRFGKIKTCEVIRDKKTGDSLQYAFVEFEDEKSCEDAYFKMDNVLIDDRRIHVDFSQSVAKVRWHGKGRISYFNEDEKDGTQYNLGNGKYQRTQNKRNLDVLPQKPEKKKHNISETYNKVHKSDRKYSGTKCHKNRYVSPDKKNDGLKKQRSRSREKIRKESSKTGSRYDNKKRTSLREEENYENKIYKRNRSIEKFSSHQSSKRKDNRLKYDSDRYETYNSKNKHERR